MEAYSAEAGPSQGEVALVGCPWVGGAGDGREAEHPPGRAAALVGVSCQGVGVLALLVGALEAACPAADHLTGHSWGPLEESLFPPAALEAYAVVAVDWDGPLVGHQATGLWRLEGLTGAKADAAAYLAPGWAYQVAEEAFLLLGLRWADRPDDCLVSELRTGFGFAE